MATVIKTKVLCPTNTRGTRIKAESNGFSVTITYPYEGEEASHYAAVKALIEKHNLNWDISKLTYGSDENGDHFFTFPFSNVEFLNK